MLSTRLQSQLVSVSTFEARLSCLGNHATQKILNAGTFVYSGKYLRKNPLARAGFIFYLILIHLWTFALLFFHAHSFDTERGDLRSAIGASHGPHVLMMKQNQAQVVKSVGAFGHADASAAISNVDIDKRGNQVNAEIIKAQGADEPVGAAAAEANSGNGA